MQYQIKFTKVSGAGNDFVLIDGLQGVLPQDKALLAQALCSRESGVGADGLLVLESSDKADFRMQYYNADGSYGGMCGNGGRCIARYARLQGIAGDVMSFEALDHTYRAEVKGRNVCLWMKQPQDFRRHVRLDAEGSSFDASYINTGSPHVVIFTDKLDTLNVPAIGRHIRQDSQFKPAGTNVNFVQITGPSSIRIRTYERGVEDETRACGTGAVASAVVSFLTSQVQGPVQVGVRSGETLVVSFEMKGESVHDVSLEGSAHMLFEGSTLYDDGEGQERLTLFTSRH